MKHKIIALLVLLWSGTLTVLCQSHYKSDIWIGAHGGAQSSYVFFNPSVPQNWPIGYTAGIDFKYIEEKHFGLIAEVNWTQRGWGEDFEGAPYNYRRIADYISIPVLAHIYFGRRGRFFINLGPEVSFFLKQTTRSNFDPAQIATLPEFPIRNRTNTQQTLPIDKKVDYGITAGLGGEFSINPKNAIGVEIRAYYGLGNILPDSRKDVFSLSNQLTIAATLGYHFRIK